MDIKTPDGLIEKLNTIKQNYVKKKVVNQNFVICPEMYGKPCPICEYFKKLKREKGR